MNRHGMVTRLKGKEALNQEEMEEVEEVIGEWLEEQPQEDQLENPNLPQPEQEVEVMIGDQPTKPTQKEDLSTQEMFRIMMEQMNKDKEERRQDKDCLLYTSRCV